MYRVFLITKVYFHFFLIHIKQIVNLITILLSIITPLYYTTNIWACLPSILTALNHLSSWHKKRGTKRLSYKYQCELNEMYVKNLINVYDCYGNILKCKDNNNLLILIDSLFEKSVLINDLIVNVYQDEEHMILLFYGPQSQHEKLETDIRIYIDSKNTTDGVKYYALINRKKVQKNTFINPLYKPEFYGMNNFNYVDNLIKQFLDNREFYQTTGLPYRIGFCFPGDKGTGKTNLAYSIGKNFNLDIVEIDPNHEFNFESISLSNCVILLDDLKILTSRAVAG